MKKLIEFFKKETVLSIAMVLAVISAFFVHPNKGYIEYIDWRTLGILLSLMIIMEGFKRTGFFDAIGSKLLKHTKKLWQLIMVLVMLCFFFSMLITNDVALLTFVPFTVMIMEQCDQKNAILPTIVLQTVAANLGSMMTPIGNPQNLYLYGVMQCNPASFMMILLPYTLIAFVLLVVSVMLIKGKNTDVVANVNSTNNTSSDAHKRNVIYGILFLLALLVVAKLVPYYVLLIAVVLCVIACDKETLLTVDYALIFIFISFFVLIGNLGNMPAIRLALSRMVETREVYIAVLASQFISNVPATLLLSGFTADYRSLLIGVNLGGLGTFIASMASLISYKIFAHRYNDLKGKYLVVFSIVNVIYLVVLLAGYNLIG